MAEAAERGNWWKAAIATVVAIEFLGGLSGWLSNSGYGNGWFDALHKPDFHAAGLGVRRGLANPLRTARHRAGNDPRRTASDRRRIALTLFFVQLALNFAWSPIFFAGHDILLAKWVIFVMAAVAAAAARQFFVLRKTAGVLLIPYLGWLVFAATLNATIEALNPGAGTSLLG